ncbi:hypothetical protein M3700_02710 [Micrococcus luteus]|uniref:hypothetical protein n=1 Tax=Micrococcus luteus TaxID=1270 RepID=UPI00128B008E|nr:hypothetical protein [Micrococcus luteus]MCT1868706.1 hypothetical protein [Micrococcus luteus]MCT2324595.1 hypothetical protein [Micrococcus luteus]MCV7551546.1 hypothetical protein [Micrococcus luteus]MCV7716293.1 hypothetical protein [Micrococcus luteus]MCV7749739.1 hypothetical protein [Micrococcus luteus]
MHPRRSRATSHTVQGAARRWRPGGAMACMFVASLAVSGCAPGSDGDGELTVGVIDGFVQPAGSGLRPVGPEKDKSGSGRYCHYHGNNRKPEGIHAFYGVAGQGTC